MIIGIVGLGKMGGNMARRLMNNGHQCVVHDLNAKAVGELQASGAIGAGSLDEMIGKLPTPRAIWIMLPAGEITEKTVAYLGDHLAKDDIVIDGGNSFYKDDIRRAHMLSEKGLHYVDVGTSGGVWGLERGYCMMIGGEKSVIDHLDPIFDTLAPGKGDIDVTPGREARDTRPERGYLHAGGVGAGHFVKMIHNGIEYGLMQAYAEGFEILEKRSLETLPSDERFTLDLADIAEVWRRGSVVSSWLLDLTASALAKNPGLQNFSGYVADSGEGRWTIEAAIEEAVPATVLSASLYERFRSRMDPSFADKILSAMRYGFGGHIEQHGTAEGPAQKHSH